MEKNCKNHIFIIKKFLVNFEGRPISADLSRPISVLAHNSTMLGQNHNMGCFSNSEFIAESESAFGIWKFQEFWNFSDALESLRKLAKLGLFGPFCKNKTLFPCKLKPQIRFWCQKVEICKIPAFWNLFWNHWNLPINTLLLGNFAQMGHFIHLRGWRT